MMAEGFESRDAPGLYLSMLSGRDRPPVASVAIMKTPGNAMQGRKMRVKYKIAPISDVNAVV